MGARRTGAPLVGRASELRCLQSAVRACATRPVVLVGGEAGIGKTRLVSELARRHARAGGAVAIGTCVELGGDLLPFAPFVDALTQLLERLGPRADDVVVHLRADLAGLLPVLGRGDPPGAGPVGRARLFQAVFELLEAVEAPSPVRASGRRVGDPLVVVLEDLHWADRSTLELLEFLARRLRRGRCALVGTFRTDELHRRHPLVPFLAGLERAGLAARCDVSRLEPVAIGDLVGALGVPPGTAAASEIARRSEGNPFFVEQLVAWHGGDGRLPDTLREILLARVADVPPPTRHLLGVLAVTGRPVDQELLDLVWGGRPGLTEAERDGLDRGLVIRAGGGSRLALRHALLAEAIADDLLPGERVRLHEVMARVLGDRPDLGCATAAGAMAELATHLVAARDDRRALRVVVRAGDLAVAARAFPEARAQYERALELFERVPEAPALAGVDLASLLDRTAEAAFHGGEVRRAMALGERAVEVAKAAGDAPLAGRLLVRLIEWTEEVDFAPIEDLAREALALVPAYPPTPERAFALIGLGAASMHARCQWLEVLEATRAGADVAAACGATGYEAIARSMAALALAGLARDEEAAPEADRALRLLAASAGAEEVAIGTANSLAAYAVGGHVARVAALLPEARRAVERAGSGPMSDSYLAILQAGVLVATGAWGEALGVVTEAIEAETPPAALVELLLLRAILRIRGGELEAGAGDLAAVTGASSVSYPQLLADVHGARAELELVRGRAGEALAEVQAGLRALGPSDSIASLVRMHALGLRASADLAERSRARREAAPLAVAIHAGNTFLACLADARDGRLVPGAGVNDVVRAMVAWGLAEATRLADTPTPDAWAAAAAALDAVGEAHIAAYGRYREAEAALQVNADRDRAGSALRAARSWATRVGAAPLLADVDGLARRARLPLQEPTPPVLAAAADVGEPAANPWGLSPRETEVLELLVDGCTNREIGERLFITERTASVHVSHILDKLAVPSRGAAAAMAARGGLVAPRGR